MTLGQYIAARRKVAGLSQEALGERLGLSQSAVSRLELGEASVTVGQLQKIADVVGFDIGEAARLPIIDINKAA